MEAKSLLARGHIRLLVLNGVLTAGSRIDVTEIAEALNISAVPVREALIRLSERQLIKGGSRQNYHVHKPSQSEQLDALCWAQALFRKAVERFVLREDRASLIASIQAAAAEKHGLQPTVFCFRIVDAIGKVGLTEIEYLLFSITLDNLLLTPPIQSEVEHGELKSALTVIVDLVVDGGDYEEVGEQISNVADVVERMIVLAHTQNVADLLFKES